MDSDTVQSFRLSLSNRFQPLQDLNIEDEWSDIKESINRTCAEVLGTKTAEHKEWITPGTMGSISKRKHLKEEYNRSRTRREKSEAHKTYEAANSEVKRKIKQDKREYYDTLATKAEEAAAHGNMKDLYDTTRKLAGKFQQTSSQVKDKEGNILTREDEQLKRWAQYSVLQ